ncbi:unnamed protein product [Acanthoscelides obtectus]|uniref:Phospholipase B1, membrane-associated n=1 Tax=Acanthoscelides obtectus TaxID=200917 RepID=A0A9P0K764_ACAOB|nr:unnamed protein product [Acanthoscelides obtectus]CAK1651899.1 Phospholipase B1, membrane-associated [Acanthoscelides obtectus]
MHVKNLCISFTFFFLNEYNCQVGRSWLDDALEPIYWPLRRTLNEIVKSVIENRKATERNNLPKPELSENLEFPCKFSTPRSEKVPQSVHKLRPGDIDLIGVIGDSLTAGTSVSATNLLELPAEERGASFAGGGADTWRTRLTLPNILKEFNPQLSGYATGTSLYIEKAAGLNFAEPAAFSSDMFTFIQLLVQRIMNDPTVDFRKDWKMITIMMGHNDFCTANCNLKNPYDALIMHAKDLVKVLRFIRDNLPRTIVNIVPPYAATDLWNSLMGTSYGRKTVDIDGNKLICPTEEHPYICTKRNSRQCNVAMNKIMN